ncbi:acetyl-CoA carboxylase biotin carboxyl carrier protein [Gluconobacter frateurii]|uniref:Biotin carboxyl carrier protein of acetyl-CoA carboxylase n=1 Tax=Gluconobacter frateurii NRIC 0228 TaxID=1307946 RepID=A0ABQ0QAS3_9PROT|nr:biotin/lipoyl-containing protein [Gluconobacter frateurii]GBR11266.1 acetyl-CoA carboxylase biotin carboxyl carrier protein [Gluconobacter frateurii NRIC 0228]GLP89049.1 acetyl-CoA carboxylase biotin carboxyl carrier protein subunit [Gluconobacter frateurii]
MMSWMDRIREAIELAGRSGVTEMELREGEIYIRLSRSPAVAVPSAPLPQDQSPTAIQAIPAPSSPIVEEVRPSEHIVSAPAYGIFHQRPAPGSPPFVTVGDKVEKGQQVGLMESMKVFSAIEADASGTVMALLASDGEEVEAGAPLLRLQ